MNRKHPRERQRAAGTAQAALVACALFGVITTGADTDTSEWACSQCPLAAGWDSQFDFGLGYVSDDAYKFGDYRGLDDEGAYLIGSGDFRYWGDNGQYWEIVANDLGLDSRELQLAGGREGLYRLRVSYDELPRRRFDSALSPFTREAGTLSLPAGWVSAGASSLLPGLDAALRPVGIEHDRKTWGLGLDFTPPGRLHYALELRHEDRDGTGIRSGSFISQFAQLFEPIDYRSDELDASVTWVAPNGQLKLGYYGSWFANSNTTLRWQNPFTPLLPGVDQGRLALPPDNQAHQLSLSGSYRWAGHTRFSGSLTGGRLSQNDTLTGYTITPGLGDQTLPFQSLDAEVDTTRLHLRIINRPRKRLRLTLDYNYDERDNTTPVAFFDTVQSDLFVQTDPRRNLPYSFERQKWRLHGSYRLRDGARLSAGFDHKRIDRDLQEVARTEEDALWVKLRLPRTFSLASGASVKFFFSERDGSSYRAPEELGTFQNPLLRKFNLADRDRTQAELNWPLSPHERVDLTLNLTTSDDDYTNSALGLLETEWMNILVDGAVRMSDRLSIHGSYSHETYDSRQAGSQSFGMADWLADSEDTIDTSMLGVGWHDLDRDLRLGLDFVYASSESDIALISAGGVASVFPELITRLKSATLFVDYAVRENLRVRGSVWYERFRSDDWMLDDVGVTQLPSALLFGLQSSAYNVTVLGVSFTWQPGG